MCKVFLEELLTREAISCFTTNTLLGEKNYSFDSRQANILSPEQSFCDIP